MRTWKLVALLGSGGLLLQTGGCGTMLLDWFLNALVNAFISGALTSSV